MSKKYYCQENLESIREDVSLFYKDWQRNRGSKDSLPNEIRCRFSFWMYCKLMHEKTNSPLYKRREEHALEKYDSLLPCKETFSMYHKS